MSSMKRKINSRRLKENENATVFNYFDIGDFMDMRQEVQGAFFAKHGVKLDSISAVMMASVVALKEQPIVNAVIDNTEIVYRD